MSQRPGVLLLHSSAGGYGADRQLALIAGRLDRYRALAVLAHDGPLVQELRAQGVETVVDRLAVLRRAELSPAGIGSLAGGLLRSGTRIARLARDRGVALIHSNTSVTLTGAVAARLAGIPHVWHVREIYSDFTRLWPVHRRLLLGAGVLPCVSEAVRAQFRGAAQALVVHDGLGLPIAEPPPPLPLHRGGGLVCTVAGRISAWKGQEVLLEAIAGVEGAVAVIAGDAWPGQEHREHRLRQLASELGIADRVRFVGFVGDPSDLYAASDVIVVPSTSPDPLPNSALEGAAAGRCVVASAHGGLPEIVRDGETGLLVEPGNAEALGAALRRLSRSPKLVGRLGAAAAADVRTRFAPAVLLDRLQAIYDSQLSGPE